MLILQNYTLFKLVLFISLFAPNSTGNPLPPSPLVRDVASRSLIDSAAQFPGNVLNADDALQHPRIRQLEQRTNGLKLTYAYHVRSIVPIEIAAQSLVYFYNSISVKALGAWENLPPTKYVGINFGNLVLSMTSNDPIPWNFVIRFVNKMIRATRLGFTGTYEIMYEDQSTNTVVCILLRVFDHKTGLETRSSATPTLEGFTIQIERSNPNLRDPIDRPPTGNQQLHRQRSNPRSYTQAVTKRAAPPKTSLKKRTPKPTTVYALQVFRARALILPVALVAGLLEDFYDIVALKVETGFWGSIPPLHSLVLKRWNYELTFFCYTAPVPWNFVQEVALEMSSWASKGFTAEFDALYSAIDSLGKELFVSVTMRLVR